MQPLPHRYNAIDTLCSALTPPTVATMNIAEKRIGTPVDMDANAASRVQPAPKVACEVVERTRGHHHERQVVLHGHPRRHRPIAAGHGERFHAVLPGLQHAHADPAFAELPWSGSPLGSPHFRRG